MKIIDLHCDTIYKIYHEKKGNLYQNSYSVDIKKLIKGNYIGQFFALFIDKEWIKKNNLDIYQHLKELYKVFIHQIKTNEKYIKLAKNYNDLTNNILENKLSAFLTVEEGGFLQGNLERLDEFYKLGLRLITLTWNYENSIGYPNSRDKNIMSKGLKPFGFEVIERMNELGIIIDVSHLSDGGFYDCINHSKKPIIASHSNARALRNVPRNMSDDMLRLLGEKGGVIGINFAPDFLGIDGVSRVEYMVKHIKYIVNISGIEALSLGTDFDGITGKLEINNSGDMDKLIYSLAKSGFNSSEIEKISFENAARIIKECL
ncbi:MAG TPA: membrane dipeptidase [Eubacteriaceae bacterium]|nr:membrane dipeptidase [Eubacteriaceae bacterium]